MWKNEVMPPFIQYLRNFNDQTMRSTGDASKKVSFFGLDLYSLHRSAAEVLKYLDKVDPEGARKARKQCVRDRLRMCQTTDACVTDTIASNGSVKTQPGTRTKHSLVFPKSVLLRPHEHSEAQADMLVADVQSRSDEGPSGSPP